ncbi:hypothetical protein BRC70_09340 [Halobacteriales archaeon QH_6_68_27]|nr:MAG: hypothetical protein BRC70_09340 [Halobacteriales archaeon QH_6_68_27]
MDATVLYVRSGSGRRAPPDGEGLSIAEVTTAAAARDAVAAGTVDAVVVEVDECGLDPVAAVRAADSPVPILACSGTAAGDLAARATRRGADEYYPREDAEPALSDRVRAHLGDETGSAAAAGNGSGKPAISRTPSNYTSRRSNWPTTACTPSTRRGASSSSIRGWSS